jgi:glucosamine--fructose-6-phosphate aminotransferase (isomerizing)
MCGIISALSMKDDVSYDLLTALGKLEYRGYDSVGISIMDDNAKLRTIKTVGKVNSLEKLLQTDRVSGLIGIGHTRWATHGKVSVQNAHPHTAGGIAIVHNGIIENYRELKSYLLENGFVFNSESDSEVISALIAQNLKTSSNDFTIAFRQSISQLIGTYAIVSIFDQNPNLIIGAKKGSPMAIGTSNDQQKFYIASDAIALSGFCDKISYLEDGDFVVCEKTNHLDYKIFSENWVQITRDKIENLVTTADICKNGFEDFMLKEIFEEPEVVSKMLTQFSCEIDVSRYRSIYIIACGTSFYAGLISKYWIEDLIGVHVDVEIASEFRYRNPVLPKDSLYIFISQSGETIDTLSAMKKIKQLGFDTISIVNVDGSSIARGADKNLLTIAGIEIGVASTKSFVAQAIAMLILTYKRNKLNLKSIENLMYSILNSRDKLQAVSEKIKNSKSILYMGRGSSYPIALEGALKMKELSYISAEGYPSGETKHGPIAMIDSDVYSVIIAPFDRYFDKTFSNAQEILARQGRIIFITTDAAEQFIDELSANELVDCIVFRDTLLNISHNDTQIDEILKPLSFATAVHLLAYYTAKAKGFDADKPRNLAKSVTVE